MTYINNEALSGIDAINSGLSGTVLRPIISWDPIAENPNVFPPDPVPFKSPDNPPYLDAWDFCYDISTDSVSPYFIDNITTINFGKDRNTTQTVLLPLSFGQVYQIRAYFQIESVSSPGTFYRTPYVYSFFVYNIVG